MAAAARAQTRARNSATEVGRHSSFSPPYPSPGMKWAVSTHSLRG